MLYNFPILHKKPTMPRGEASKKYSRSGRIYPHERHNVDYAAEMVGKSIALPNNMKEEYQKTINHEMTDKYKKDYRRRIQRICKYWKEHTLEIF